MEIMSMDEDGGSPTGSPPKRKAISRRKKSADQIEVLENLYSENKYPSEEVRAKMSAQLGLSEKQLQIWFTHRRHKDRKDGVEDVKLTFYAMRHKGAEGSLEKLKENLKDNEPRCGKVAERVLNGREELGFHTGYPLLASPSRGCQNGNGHYMYDRRLDSESENSGLGEAEDLPSNGVKSSSKRGSLINRKDAVYKRPNPIKPKVINPRNIELAAMAAVEAQLGEAIREDGPCLGMEFDQLPPDAMVRLSSAPASTTISGQGREGRFPNTEIARNFQ